MNSVALKKVVRLALMEKIDPNTLQALIIKSTLNNQEEHLRKKHNSSDIRMHNTCLFTDSKLRVFFMNAIAWSSL